MNTLTIKQINMATRGLESAIKKANRQLFEFGVLQSFQEFSQGKSKTYKSADALMRAIEKHK